MEQNTVVVGEEFESVDAQLIKAQSEKENNRIDADRSLLMKLVVFFTILSLSTAAAIGYFDGSYDELQNVWMVTAPFVGAILAFYFRFVNTL